MNLWNMKTRIKLIPQSHQALLAIENSGVVKAITVS